MGVENPAQYRSIEFRSFESFVIEWLAVRDVNRLDYIFQPQYQFVCDEQLHPVIDYIENMSLLHVGIQRVESEIGRNINLPHVNRTSSGDDYRNMYSPRMVDIVGQIYRADIELFGFSFSDDGK
jgi:hypothetical protein